MGLVHWYFRLVGRIFLALIFLMSGLGKIFNFAGTLPHLTSKGIPVAPLFLVIAIVLELSGSICLMLGIKTKEAALALALFLIPTTLIMHNFWAYQGVDQQGQMIHFLKNISILGGLFIVASGGAERTRLS